MALPRLSQQQIEQFKQVFRLMDANGDGKISQGELLTIMGRFGYQACEKEVAEMVNSIDKDQNGTIELEEFLAFIAKQTTKPSAPRNEREELLRVFQLFDRDGNGHISREELLVGLNELGEAMSEQEVMEIMESADVNGDGNIDFQEFAALMGNK